MNRKEFKKWLEEMDNFEFSRLLEINNDPLSIILGYMPEDESDLSIYYRVIFLPNEIDKWDFKETNRFKPSENTEIRQIDMNEQVKDKIDLRFIHSFNDIHLICTSIKIEKILPISIKPKLNFTETLVNLSAPPQPILTPKFWIEALHEKQLNCCFRMFGGEAEDLNIIPTDYSGFFISKKERITATHSGVFILASTSNQNSMFIKLECQDEKSYDVWIEMISIFSNLDNTKITINDITFNRSIWKKKYKAEYQKRL